MYERATSNDGEQEDLLFEDALRLISEKNRSHCTPEFFVRGLGISLPVANRLIGILIDEEVLGETREADGHLVLPGEQGNEDAEMDDEAGFEPAVTTDVDDPSTSDTALTAVAVAVAVAMPQRELPERRTGQIETVRLDQIDADPLFALRQKRNEDVVEDYAADMQRGNQFPRPLLVRDGDRFQLIDGDHRCQARQLAGFEDIEAEVIEGEPHELLIQAILANRSNGLRFSREELRAALDRCLADPELRLWSNTVLGQLVGVSDQTVGRRRKALDPDNVEGGKRKHVRNGEVVEAKPSRTKTAAEDHVEQPPCQEAGSTTAETTVCNGDPVDPAREADILLALQGLAQMDEDDLDVLLREVIAAAPDIEALIHVLHDVAGRLESLLGVESDLAGAEVVPEEAAG
jgi:hypothetical protein